MAISLFRRAADAIVAKSELAQNVKSLESETTWLKTRVDSLTNERQNLDDTVRYLTAQLTEAKKALDEQTNRADTLTYRNDNMATMIASLEASVALANKDRDDAIAQYVDESDAHAKTKALHAEAQAKLESITTALGLPKPVAPVAPVEVAPVDTFRTEPDVGTGTASDLHPAVPSPEPAASTIPWSSSHTGSYPFVSPQAEATVSDIHGTPGTSTQSPVPADPHNPSSPYGVADDDYMPF